MIKKHISDLRLQDEIKLFTALIMVLVICFQMIIYTYYTISFKVQREYIRESIDVMMNETISNHTEALEKFRQFILSGDDLKNFLKNPEDTKSHFELENLIYMLQQISDNTIHGVVFDNDNRLYNLSPNISEAKTSEIEKTYLKYLDNKQNYPYYFFSIPDSMYREIYFLSFTDVRENVYETASTKKLGTLCLFLQISTDTMLNDYSITKNSKFYLQDNTDNILLFDRGNTTDSMTEISNIKIRNTDWYMNGYVNAESTYPGLYQLLMLIALETLFTYFAILLLNKCIKLRMINPFNDTKKYIDQLSISQVFKPLEVKGNKDITEFASNINNMVIRNKKLANSVLLKQQRLYEAEHLRDTATLYALQNQVNPHFMYNIFEMIRSLAVVDGNAEIETIVNSISKLLRYNLKNDTIVPLKAEYDITLLYMNIMKIKYGNAFDVEYNIDEKLYEAPVMKMIFQPILENAFNHGFVRKPEKFKINISVFSDDEKITFVFKDNGLGISEEKLKEIRSNFGQRIANGEKQIGLANLDQRLNMCYGSDNYTFSINSKENEFTETTITIKKLG